MSTLISAKILTIVSVFLLAGTMQAQGRLPKRYIVYSGSVPESGIVRPGMVRWVRADQVTSIEWHYQPGHFVEPVIALVEADEWPFTINVDERTARLELDDEIRERWDEHGRLIVRFGSSKVEFRAKPRRLEPSSIRERWTVYPRRESVIPGSRDYLKLSLGDITDDQVSLTLRRGDGELVSPARSFREGDRVEFTVGDQEYSLRLQRLHVGLILDFAEFRIAHEQQREVEEKESVSDPVVRERTVATDSGTLFVRTGGSGPDIVLLHGLGDSSVGWRKIEQPLRDSGFRVTVWDALGAGRSERPDPGDYHLASHVDRLGAVLDDLGIRRAHVIGNSLGGTMALLFAQAHPERVSSLVLINPAAYPEGGTTPDWFWETPGLAETVLGEVPTEWIARLALYLHFGDPFRVTEEDVQIYAAEAQRNRAVEGLILQERQLYPDDVVIARWVEGHKKIAAPTLILWGTSDRILSIDQAHRLEGDLPDAKLILLEGVGHVAQLEVPKRVLAEAVLFLRKR